jgi:hypothetical protein
LDLIIVLGPLADDRAARQLAGVVKVALRQSKATFIFGYPEYINGADAEFFADFFGDRPVIHVSSDSVTGFPDEFRTYFTQYGRSAAAFSRSWTEPARVIGWIRENEAVDAPTALCWESDTSGAVYAMPYCLGRTESAGDMLSTLCAAVVAHRDALAVALPDYLSELRIGACETALRVELEQIEHDLAAKRADASALERWRYLISRTSGPPLVELVVDAVNVVLEGSRFRAEMRDDVAAEDFWIIGPDGDFALAEAKGISGGISRRNVSQVDSHREARGLQPEFPGLLVVNVFRRDGDLTRKTTEEIAPNVISLAQHHNVTLLRTWDLYQLVGRKLDGENVGELLLDALRRATGGWLRSDVAAGSAILTSPK